MLEHEKLGRVSEPCRSLLRRMLRKNPEERPTAAQCLEDEWLVGNAFKESPPTFPIGATQNLWAYNMMSSVRRACFLLAVVQGSPAVEAEARRIFAHHDL